MAQRSQRTGMPARSALVSRRQARQARAQLAAGGLSHQEQRRVRTLLRAHEVAAQRRRRRVRRIGIVATAAVVAMAIATLSFGLIPAIDAALGGGATGTFVVGQRECSSKVGCQWTGTFHSGTQPTVSGLVYAGALPSGDSTGSVIPARYPGGSDQVYALHGSHTWVLDLLITLVIGLAVGAALWISPIGDGRRSPASRVA